MLRYFLSIFFLLSVPQYLYGQISGTVRDASTKEPIPYVHVSEGTVALGITDFDGKFNVTPSSQTDSILFSIVGYERLTFKLSTKTLNGIEIYLKPLEEMLEEVEVRSSKYDPALELIKKVVEHAVENNPKKIEKYRYRAYNKTVLDIEKRASAEKDAKPQKIGNKNNYLMIMETVTDHWYMKPDKVKKEILASKVSGFSQAGAATTVEDYLSVFGFYDPVLEFFENEFVNPVSKKGTKLYYYDITDTLEVYPDTVFLVEFIPKKSIDGLKGSVAITKDNYAIKKVEAATYEERLVDFSLKQSYDKINGQWFPIDLFYDFQMNGFPSSNENFKGKGSSILKNIEINPLNLQKRDFGDVSLKIANISEEESNALLDEYRTIDLTDKELKTYAVMDSVGNKYKFDDLMKYGMHMYFLKIPLSVIDLDVSNLIIRNEWEGYRIGLGVHTNERLIEWFTFGGFARYGTRDKKWKWGVDFSLRLNEPKQVYLRAGYAETVIEAGRNGMLMEENNMGVEEFLAYKMDRTKIFRAEVSFETPRYLQTTVGVRKRDALPLYTPYLGDGQQDVQGVRHDFSEAYLGLRYAFGEEVVEMVGRRVRLQSKYPVLMAYYIQGVENVLDGEYDYHRLELKMKYTWPMGRMGESTISTQMGYLWGGNLPYNTMFVPTGTANNALFSGFIFNNAFQTMGTYEFLADRYAHLFYTYDFGNWNWGGKFSSPRLVLAYNAAIGKVDRANNFDYRDFNVYDKGYHEAGLILRDILKVNFFQMIYLGAGIGGFYRLGDYSYGNWEDNIALKLAFTMSLR